MKSLLAWTLFADVVPEPPRFEAPPKPPGFEVGGFEVRGNYAFWVAVGMVAAGLIGFVILVLMWLIRRRKK